jgi:transposase
VDPGWRAQSGFRHDTGAVWASAAPAHELDAYKAIVETRLAAYPALSAVRLLGEIRAAGFAGSYTQLKAFVRQVRPTPPAAPVIRFETPPGRQAQVDFARFAFPWGVRYALLVVLGYSRLLRKSAEIPRCESPETHENPGCRYKTGTRVQRM